MSAAQSSPFLPCPSPPRLCGYTPFRSDDPAKLAAETQRGKIEFHDRYWKNISELAKDFIRACLKVDPATRLTADEALSSGWLVEGAKDNVANHDISLGLRENYRKRWKVSTWCGKRGAAAARDEQR